VQTNGLYKVNPSWSGAKTVLETYGDKYFANLSAYGTDAKGNKVLGEDAVEYNYSDKVTHDGNDGIAFYFKDNKYYANSNYTTEVVDFALLSEEVLPTRHNTVGKSATMQQTIVGNGAWQTIIFYIHTGNQEKNFRLEVWSGTRDGATVNGADSYVIFDTWNVGSDEGRYSNMLDLRKETIEDMGANETNFFFEGAYSFYDTDKFLRYDKNLDENAVGDSYESYKSSAYASGVAFLQYQDGEGVEMYVDYALSEQMPDADVEEDDSDEEDEDDSEIDAANIWLLAGSIVISVALLFAVGAVIVRKVILKKRPATKKAKKNKKD
jgi:hypothetical protein